MQKKKTDNEIKQQVLRELKWDSRIGWSQVGVEVLEGVVTLTGVVANYAKKLAAQEAAHLVALDGAHPGFGPREPGRPVARPDRKRILHRLGTA